MDSSWYRWVHALVPAHTHTRARAPVDESSLCVCTWRLQLINERRAAIIDDVTLAASSSVEYQPTRSRGRPHRDAWRVIPTSNSVDLTAPLPVPDMVLPVVRVAQKSSENVPVSAPMPCVHHANANANASDSGFNTDIARWVTVGPMIPIKLRFLQANTLLT